MNESDAIKEFKGTLHSLNNCLQYNNKEFRKLLNEAHKLAESRDYPILLWEIVLLRRWRYCLTDESLPSFWQLRSSRMHSKLL